MKNLSLLLEKFRVMSSVKRGLLLGLAGAICLVFLGLFSRISVTPPSLPPSEFLQNEPLSGPEPRTDAGSFVDEEKSVSSRQTMTRGEQQAPAKKEISGGNSYDAALIAHSAELTVATKEFGKSRTSLEEILERHRGYAAKLRMQGRRTGSVLSASLRIPSLELTATVSELKSLGDVEQEEQTADEITQQRADLDARLSNARNTLRRLQALLKGQTYADGNVRELQRQITNATAEVNRLEGERSASDHRIIFANVQFSLREIVSAPEESLGAQLHTAASAGFSEAAASLSAILLFLIGRGPVVLLWCVILYVPARLIWRRWQPTSLHSSVPTPGV